MQPGQANTLVRLLQRTPSTDPINAPGDAWTEVGSFWADVRHKTGLQTLTADQLHTGARCSVRTRQTSCTRAIVAGNAMRIDGKVYHVIDTLPQGRDAIDILGEVR